METNCVGSTYLKNLGTKGYEMTKAIFLVADCESDPYIQNNNIMPLECSQQLSLYGAQALRGHHFQGVTLLPLTNILFSSVVFDVVGSKLVCK